MNKEKLTKFAKSVQMGASKHSPEILIGFGIAGMITGVVLAVPATVKALRKIDEKKKEVFIELEEEGNLGDLETHEDVELTKAEVVKATWPCYIPTAVTCVASTACIIGANKVNLKRNAALATAYKLSETALTEYKEKVVETIGEKKERKVREEISKDKLKKDPVGNKEIIITGKGKTRFYDVMGERRFESDMEVLRKIENNLNRRMRDEMHISLNDLYDEIGLTRTPLGDIVGWDIDKGYIEMQFDSMIDEDGVPCIVVDYLRRPDYMNNKYY